MDGTCRKAKQGWVCPGRLGMKCKCTSTPRAQDTKNLERAQKRNNLLGRLFIQVHNIKHANKELLWEKRQEGTVQNTDEFIDIVLVLVQALGQSQAGWERSGEDN